MAKFSTPVPDGPVPTPPPPPVHPNPMPPIIKPLPDPSIVPVAKITVLQALKVLKVGYWAPWILLVGYIAVTNLGNIDIVPRPIVPVVPAQKTLRDRVSPEAAIELGNLYHSMASGIYCDGKSKDSIKKDPRLQNVGQISTLHTIMMESFQNTRHITGIAGINEPIKAKFKRATGSLPNSTKIDDPATNVRASVVAICKEISEEFNPEMRSVPLQR